MKKIYIIIAMTLLCSRVFAQVELPNGGLENWHMVTNLGNPGLDYLEPGIDTTDTWLATLNSLAQIPSTLLGPGPITAFRSDDKHSGTYSAKLVTDSMNLPNTIIIPGMLGTATMVGLGAKLGRPSTAKPVAFSGWYKYTPDNGDSCTAIVLSSKWNSTLHKRDTIGFGKFVGKEAVTTWTAFNVHVSYNYPAANETPDSLTILCISSAGFNIYNFLACQGQTGSTMYVDDLMLTYQNGVIEHLMDGISVKTSPNPCTDRITFKASKNIGNSQIIIWSASGAMVEKITFAGSEMTVPVSGLASGIYRFTVTEGKNIISGGTFTVAK